MPGIRLETFLARFASDLDAVSRFLRDSQSMFLRREDGTFRRLSGRQVEGFSSYALLEMQLAWEDFLEAVFLRYMCGAKAPSGAAPSLLVPRHQSIASATAEIMQRQPYVSWNYDESVSRASRYFLNGEPFRTPLAAVRTTIESMTIVRNAVAHRSESARNRFRGLVRDEFGYVPRGMTPGRFVLAIVPGTPETFVENYRNNLAAAAALIVP